MPDDINIIDDGLIIVPDRKPPVFGRRHILNFELFLNFMPLLKKIPSFPSTADKNRFFSVFLTVSSCQLFLTA